jgi:hypothetical protein
VIVALVNLTWVIVAVQLLLGQPPAVPFTGCGTGLVVTLKATVPFLTSLAGIDSVPVAVTEPGFCPGAWLPPAFVQDVVGIPVAERVMSTSPLPRPARFPDAVSVRAVPLFVKLGDPGLKWTLAAYAAVAIQPRIKSDSSWRQVLRRIRIFLPFRCATGSSMGARMAGTTSDLAPSPSDFEPAEVTLPIASIPILRRWRNSRSRFTIETKIHDLRAQADLSRMRG